jgi:type IV pilus assembly protein PilB
LLHDIIRLPKEIHDQVVTRIKVLSNLRTDEHHAPQDGKIEYRIEADEGLSLRVSIVPVIHGEKVVLRLLADQSKRLSLGDLGFFDQSLDKIIRAYKKPYGMILTTGPTGSGKTTTLYAILKILNRREVNITTIEDPVEYSIENVNQIQINQKTNLTCFRFEIHCSSGSECDPSWRNSRSGNCKNCG